ncbi:MAG: FkbM family methyltransferase [Pseudomonadota bacterium]
MQIIRKIIKRVPSLRRPLKAIYTFFRGMPPVSQSRISRELIRRCVGKSNPTILEIGCNDGTHTLWFLGTFESPRMYCFEPDPRAVQRFKNKVGERLGVNLFELALSDREGEIEFHQSAGARSERDAETMPEGWDLSGSIRKPKEHLAEHPWVKFDRTIPVRTTTLDAWCDEHRIETIDFIWMDVQGAEMDVFRGAEKTLARTRYIYTEYNDKELYEGQANLATLRRHLARFKVLARYPDDVLFENRSFQIADLRRA